MIFIILTTHFLQGTSWEQAWTAWTSSGNQHWGDTFMFLLDFELTITHTKVVLFWLEKMRRSALFNDEVLGMNIVKWCSRLAILLHLRCFFSVELWINEQPLFGVQDEIPNRRSGYCNIISNVQIWSFASSLKRYVSWNITVQIGSNDSKGLVGNVELEEAGALLYSAMQVFHHNFLDDADNADNILCTNTYIW